MLGEHDMLVRCNVLIPHQDIGHSNVFSLGREDAILGGSVQGSEVLIGRD